MTALAALLAAADQAAAHRPVLVATGARKAHAYHACSICRHLIEPGQRVADRADGGGPVHVAGCTRKLGGITG